jgi:hypothetical protein
MSDEKYKQMLDRHKQEIEDFRNNCPHSVISDWIPFMWAPGHFSHHVKVCERCYKTIEESMPQPVIKAEVTSSYQTEHKWKENDKKEKDL